MDHINEFNMIVSQLSSVEINFEDEIKALILMSSLPESWDTIVAAISSSQGSDKLKFDEIRDVVRKSIRKREIENSSSSALSVDHDGVNITHAEAIWILGTFRTSIIVNN